MKKSERTLKVYFENHQTAVPVTPHVRALVRRAVLATLAFENVTGHSEVSVTFTDNAGIRQLNNRFRGIDSETDVLSFPLFEDGPGGEEFGNMLGDIVLSLEKCRAQAEEYGHGFDRECAFLTVHSTLHLLGYDHVNGEAEEADMRRRQTAVVEGMGLGVEDKT